MIVKQIWTANNYRNFNYLIACPETGEALAVDPLDHEKCANVAKAAGWKLVILVGDEPYYSRVGFKKIPRGQVRLPGPVDPERVLGLALKAGALDALSGDVKRARIDYPVSAQATSLG